jgi:pilus assembly protein CpaF
MFGRRETATATISPQTGDSRNSSPQTGSPETASHPATARLAAVNTANCDGAPAEGVARRAGNAAVAEAPALSRPNGPKGVKGSAAVVPLRQASEAPGAAAPNAVPEAVAEAKGRIQALLMDAIDPAEASKLAREALELQLAELVAELLLAEKITLNVREQAALVGILVDDMVGLGPIEPLLADDSITEIMVNGPKQVYVERDGRIEPSGVVFHDDRHVMNAAIRIASRIGRRIDESSPYCDARLEDGSRVNIVVPPLALDGPTITIRKFAKKKFTLEGLTERGSLSPEMQAVLMVAGRAGVNVLISGGTGSGKTTLLNAISETIDADERVVTIEDAAELQLQQPHVVRLETRPANLEGKGEVAMRELLKNALRMRPDRIILGEVRGSEVVDMLQAMNTGHDGSLCTVHANNPREALTRLENLIAMAGIDLPAKAAKAQIASAIDLIVQTSRMRDGSRRITHITEIVGTEGEVITTQDLFVFNYEGEDKDGRVTGSCDYTGIQPRMLEKARYHNLDRALLQALHGADSNDNNQSKAA